MLHEPIFKKEKSISLEQVRMGLNSRVVLDSAYIGAKH